MRVQDFDNTTEYHSLSWTGSGFAEPIPDALWKRLPESLTTIALEEIRSGNMPESILENRERAIVLLAFRSAPMIAQESNDRVKVHTRHEYGNYCYDGTIATYEDRQSGCFLAFDNPDYEDEIL